MIDIHVFESERHSDNSCSPGGVQLIRSCRSWVTCKERVGIPRLSHQHHYEVFFISLSDLNSERVSKPLLGSFCSTFF